MMMAHRIIDIDYDNKTVSTKGDANPDQLIWEKQISDDNICCIVSGTIPTIGYLDFFYVGWFIRALIIYAILSLIMSLIALLKSFEVLG